MNLTNLEKGSVLRIWCKSDKSTFLKGYTKSTLICWVDELVAVGEVLLFENYTNYEDGWLVIKTDEVDTHTNVLKRFGWEFKIHKIRREQIDEVVEQSPTQTSIV